MLRDSNPSVFNLNGDVSASSTSSIAATFLQKYIRGHSARTQYGR